MVDEPKKMSPDIAAAIVKVIGSIGTLAKENNNNFDKYKFASIDDFIKFVRGHCADAGIFIVPQEADEAQIKDMKKKDGSPLLMWWQRFAFLIVHQDGETYGPIYKTVQVQANGAQAAGSAQSYALKQLMRGLFLIPTGDKDDPDVKGTAELTTAGEAPATNHKKAQQLYNRLKNSKDKEAFLKVWNENVMFLEELKAELPEAYEHLDKMRQERVS